MEVDGDFVDGSGLTESEEAIVSQFLKADSSHMRTLAEIIIEKIRQKSEAVAENVAETAIPVKVVEVFTAVGKMLAYYKSGKLPKALKMLPHLKNWEVTAARNSLDQCTYFLSSNHTI